MIKVIGAYGGVVQPQMKDAPTLEQVQKWVGGLVEIVDISHFDYLLHPQMLVNEEGLLRDLPVNVSASLMAGQTIVGSVVILTGEHKWD